MIASKKGDILTERADALVNTVNCVGVMGRGIALQFRNAFPENYRIYKTACDRGELHPGRMFVVKVDHLGGPQWIINFPTKRHWRGKSRIEDIEAGLVALRETIGSLGIRSIAIPPLGSGLGGLNWRDVRPRIVHALEGLDDVKIVLFEPDGAPADGRGMQSRDVPKMTPGRAALIGLIDRYLGGLMDPFVTLLEVHKLMYFMQEAGEPLRLRYTKAPYGPYAENLGNVLAAVEGHYVFGYRDGGNDPTKQLQLVPGANEEARSFLRGDTDTRARFDRVVDLVDGFETPFGLELLATVHWVSRPPAKQATEDVVKQVYAWNERKLRFSPEQIRLALDTLSAKGWVPRNHTVDEAGGTDFH